MSKVSRPLPVGQSKGRKLARPTHGRCRLTLTINGTLYSVRPIPADPGVAIKAFRIKKSDGRVYDIAQTAYGPECDCPDFVFNRDGIDPDGCKHIKAMIAVGLIEKGGAR
jgi:hypothetical protein